MGRADWHARIIRTDSSALSIVCRCAAGARARAAIRRRPLYITRSIEASSSSMLSCDSILSEACLRSSALKVCLELVANPGSDPLFAPHTCWGQSYVTLGSTRVSTNRF